MRSANTPLGRWQYDPGTGLNILDTDAPRGRWRPLIVSIALTGQCLKGCSFCYASSTPAGASAWTYQDLVDFAVDLDRNGVYSITLGGGEPTLWSDLEAGKTFYDLVRELSERVSLGLTFTTSGIPDLRFDLIPNMPVRLSCHYPHQVEFVLRCALQLRERLDHVGINFLLWRSRLAECREAILRLVSAGFDDVLLLCMRPVGRGTSFAHESVDGRDLQAFLRSLDTDVVRLSACEEPGGHPSTDMGCGASDWFISISEHRVVKACSFSEEGARLFEPTYAALSRAATDLPRLPCYRSYLHTPLARLAGHTGSHRRAVRGAKIVVQDVPDEKATRGKERDHGLDN